MRRQIVFLAILAALIVGIALLRSRPRTRQAIHQAPLAPLVVELPPAIEPPTVEEAPALAVPVEAAATKPGPKTKKVRVVLEPAIEGATVILMRSRDFQQSYAPTELLSHSDGSVEFDVRVEQEWFLIYAYKPGVGHGYSHHYTRQVENGLVRVKLNPGALLKIACTGRNGEPLENIDVTVSGEIEISSSYDMHGNYLGSKRARLPARQAQTNKQGRCEFEFLNRGWTRDLGIVRVPGWIFTLTASGPGGLQEKKFDGLPEKEVAFVLD